MTTLDDRASIPLRWLFSAQLILVPILIAGAYKVFTVDARLLRIEQHLGIREGIVRDGPLKIIEQALSKERD